MRTGLTLVLLLLLLSACAPPAGPQDIAMQFWRAVIAGEPQRVRSLVRESDRAAVDSDLAVLPVRSVSLGRTVIDGTRADIETHLGIGGDAPMNLDITTVLVQVGRDWRVDYAASVRDIARDSELAQVLAQLQRLGARVGADLNRSLEDLKSAVPKLERELSKIEKEFRAQMPELRKRLEELGKNLREPQPASPAPPDYRKAI